MHFRYSIDNPFFIRFRVVGSFATKVTELFG